MFGFSFAVYWRKASARRERPTGPWASPGAPSLRTFCYSVSNMESEFDRFAAEGYSGLLRDPIRDKFGSGSRFFFERKLALLRDFYRRHGARTESTSWLDVGCGEGQLLALGRPYFRDVAGCDVSEGMIRHSEGLNVRRQESQHRIPFADGSFDLVTAVCVYHHVRMSDRAALTTDVPRVLRPGGIFCMIEHNPFNPVTQLIVRRSPLDVQARLLSAGGARRLVRAAGMRMIETRYFLYFPERFYARMASLESKLSRSLSADSMPSFVGRTDALAPPPDGTFHSHRFNVIPENLARASPLFISSLGLVRASPPPAE